MKLFITALQDGRHVVSSVDGTIIGSGSNQENAIKNALENGANLKDIDLHREAI